MISLQPRDSTSVDVIDHALGYLGSIELEASDYVVRDQIGTEMLVTSVAQEAVDYFAHSSVEALVASGMVFREYVRDSLGRFAPVHHSASDAFAAAESGEAVIHDSSPDLASMSDEELEAHVADLDSQIRVKGEEWQRLNSKSFLGKDMTPEEQARKAELDDELDDLYEQHEAAKVHRLDRGHGGDARKTQGPQLPDRKRLPESNATHEKLVYEMEASREELDPTTSRSIQDWQGDGYSQVQGALYSGNEPTPGSYASEVVTGIDAGMRPLPQDHPPLYRGMTNAETLGVGAEVSSNGYQATTVDPVIAGEFSKSAGAVRGGVRLNEPQTIIEYRGLGGRDALPVESSHELEVILGRGQRFRVVGEREELLGGTVPFRVLEVEPA